LILPDANGENSCALAEVEDKYTAVLNTAKIVGKIEIIDFVYMQ